MNGHDAVLLSVNDCGVKVLTFVPGYPITELAKALGAEITINEKVALEIALGASATGARSMVLVKQVGMNMLADPLVISATHTIGSGVVVIVGDDLGPKNSQVEMDSRYYGPLAELPVLDPKDPTALAWLHPGGLRSIGEVENTGYCSSDIASSRCRDFIDPANGLQLDQARSSREQPWS